MIVVDQIELDSDQETLVRARLLAIREFIEERGFGKQVRVREIRSLFNRGRSQLLWDALYTLMQNDPEFVFSGTDETKNSLMVTIHAPEKTVVKQETLGEYLKRTQEGPCPTK